MDVIYLDYDGVLHPAAVRHHQTPPTVWLETPGHALFESASVLEQLLEPYPAARIVLSTSWLREMSPEAARAYLPQMLASRIIGSTYQPELFGVGTLKRYSRSAQIMADVLTRKPTRWLVVDADRISLPDDLQANIVPMPFPGLFDPAAQELLRQRLAEVFSK